MTPRRNSELDSLIADITVDCYNDDECLTAFEAAFDNDATFPCPGTVIGDEVSVTSVGLTNGRRELLATCEHRGKRYLIALLDIDLHGDPTTNTLAAAYRRWNTNSRSNNTPAGRRHNQPVRRTGATPDGPRAGKARGWATRRA